MDVPSEVEWLDWPADAERPLELDEADARKKFSGKTVEEALEVFRNTPGVFCAEDVGYMPPVPFRYYMLALTAHVLALVDSSDLEKSDAASTFLQLVERKLLKERSFIDPIMGNLLPAVEFICSNQERYDADRGIYGDFREQLGRIKALCGE